MLEVTVSGNFYACAEASSQSADIVDDFSRECLRPRWNTSLFGQRVVRRLDAIAQAKAFLRRSCSRAVGQWDLGGTSLAGIVDSIRRKLLVHGDASVVVPGHGPATTVGHERRTNPYLL
jgi:hypothetical protein